MSASLSHILASDPDDSPALPPPPPPPPQPPQATATDTDTDTASKQRAGSPMSVSTPKRVDDDAVSTPKTHDAFVPDLPLTDEASNTFAVTSTKRTTTGAGASASSDNRIRHLKKEDGIPLWREDIQYDFLKLVFHDRTKCFTNYVTGSKEHTFAEVYIDAMARSSRCSKVLREKLWQSQDGAISMAMVCLLVNVGRMNTTLNFFPEMRARLRTYHSIPALQARQDPNAYKHLQDAPRLKSILKGATEDTPQPSTLEELPAKGVPRTNPVNLVFVMSLHADKVSERHFPAGGDFSDLVMRGSLSSASRARAFLWLMWHYLEGDFGDAAALNNPFGHGQVPKGKPDAPPFEVPTLDVLTPEQAALENVDTEEEKRYGEMKKKERIAILASDPSPAMTALKRARKEKGITGGQGYHASDDEGSDAGWYKGTEQRAHGALWPESGKRRKLADRLDTPAIKPETGSEYTRSPSPAAGRDARAASAKHVGDMRINNLLNSDDLMDASPPRAAPTSSVAPIKKGTGRGNWRRKRGTDAPGTSAARSSLDGSHHVPLLPNTGQINFVNDGPPQSGAPTSGSYHFSALAAKSSGSPNQGSTIAFHNSKDHVPTPSYQAQKRHRGITQHQSAVINHRKMQIDYTLDRRIRRLHMRSRSRRETESSIVRAWRRVRLMGPDYDSEEEAIKIRKARERSDKTDDDGWRGSTSGRGGKENGNGNNANDDYLDNIDVWRRPRLLLSGFIRANGETNDIGEEAKALAQTFRRAARRIERWQEAPLPGTTMLRRRARPPLLARSTVAGRRLSLASELSIEHDDDVAVPVKPAPQASRRGRGRQRGGRQSASHRGRANGAKSTRKAAVEHDMDDDDGKRPAAGDAADLDEEDRDVLGEVDADESDGEDEDADEEMEDG